MAMLIVTIVLLTLITVNCKASDNWIYINYVQTDKSTYEVGENVSITASYELQYLKATTLEEGSALSCFRGGESIAVEQCSNEPNGTYIRRLNCTLNPSIWRPSKNGENGTADCYLFLDILNENGEEDISQDRQLNFTVVRAKQNCSLIGVTPSQPFGNTSCIIMSFRVYNNNNPLFGIGSNLVDYNITSPEGLVQNNATKSNSTGYCSIYLSPHFNYGTYRVSLLSAENTDYQEGQFNYNLTVGKSPLPTTVNVTWKYCGAIFNSSSSYALEPVRITVGLTSLVDGSEIGNEELSLLITDASNSTIAQIEEPTNDSGFLTYDFFIPYEGKFVPRVFYGGLYDCWDLSEGQATNYIISAARPISIIGLNGNPTCMCLGKNYSARYLVLDGLSGKPIANETFTVKINGYSLSNETTDKNGVLSLTTLIPKDRSDLLGNCTLSLEPASTSPGRVYGNGVFSTTLLCKIPTIIILSASNNDVLEESETVSISSQLLSLNSTPISYQNLTFMIFRDQGRDPSEVIFNETDDQGISSVSVEACTQGTLTVVVIFNGSLILNASADSYSFTVIPKFQERLPSYLLSTVFACLSAGATVIIARRCKRKIKWGDLMISQNQRDLEYISTKLPLQND
jgi:hypothetical protein